VLPVKCGQASLSKTLERKISIAHQTLQQKKLVFSAAVRGIIKPEFGSFEVAFSSSSSSGSCFLCH
jgi:hypothetical protein